MQSQQNNIQESSCKAYATFDQLPLKDQLLQSISLSGFQKPTELQAKGISSILALNDTIIHSQAGTGKSVLCAISALQMINPNIQQCQALILVPTRELAFQTYTLFSKLGNLMNITMMKCFTKPGGVDNEDNSQDSGAQIIIGTISRMSNLIKKGIVQFGRVRLLVLDETDESFSRGYEEEIKGITHAVPDDVQIVISTSTMPVELENYSKKYMNDPVRVSIKRRSADIEHFKVDLMKEEWKFDTICDLLEEAGMEKLTFIVFCQKKKRAEELAVGLRKKNFKSAWFDGDLIKYDDVSMMPSEFKMGDINILAAVDDGISNFDARAQVVINYDMPFTSEKYQQRVERCAVNEKNLVVSFYTEQDKNVLNIIESYFGIKLQDLPHDFNLKLL